MNRKLLISVCAAAAVIIAAAAVTVAVLSGRENEPAPQAVSASDIRVTEGDEPRGDFITKCVYMYEQLSGEIVKPKETNGVNPSESVRKAYALGIISDSDAAVYSGSSALTREEAAQLLYMTVLKYDSDVRLDEDGVNAVLNGCYDNMNLADREACAFAMRSGAVRKNSSFYPAKMLSSGEAAQWINTVYSLYRRDHSVTMERGGTIYCGDTVSALKKVLGEPQRVDISKYGTENYIYNKGIYAIIYVSDDTVRGFFVNDGAVGGTDVYGDPKKGGAVYYRAQPAHTASPTESMRETEQAELFEMIGAYRRKNGMGRIAELDALVKLGEENSRSVSGGGIDMAIPGKRAAVSGDCAEDMYIKLITMETYKGALGAGGSRDVYAGAGLWYGSVQPCATIIIDADERVDKRVFLKKEQQTERKTETVKYTNEAPSLLMPLTEDAVGEGAPLTVRLEKRVSESFVVRVVNAETDESIVYARVYGDSITVAPDMLEAGCDYFVNVYTDAGGTEVYAETAAVRCGTPEAPVIARPHEREMIDTGGINIMWTSDFSDFSVALYNAGGELLAEQRIIGQDHARIDGLSDGVYNVEVTAYRRGTNTVMSKSVRKFWVQLGNVEIIATERPVVQFAGTRTSNVFGGSLVYSSKAEADANMVTVKVPVWKIEGGKKVSSQMSVTVNRAIAKEVGEIFTEIYNGPEKFPIKSLGGYNWRSTATGSRSQHSYGTCIDINPDENYCIYNSGTTIGKYWRPGIDPYSIRQDGDVMRAFKSRGWTWGGEWNSLKDYMHFSYLGG